MPHELFLTTREKTRIRNFFANNMLINKKCRKAHLSKIIQSGEFLRVLLGKLAEAKLKLTNIQLKKLKSGVNIRLEQH